MEGKEGKSGAKLTTKEEVKFSNKDFITENMGKFKDHYKLVSRLGSGPTPIILRRLWRGVPMQASRNRRTTSSEGHLQVIPRRR